MSDFQELIKNKFGNSVAKELQQVVDGLRLDDATIYRVDYDTSIEDGVTDRYTIYIEYNGIDVQIETPNINSNNK